MSQETRQERTCPCRFARQSPSRGCLQSVSPVLCELGREIGGGCVILPSLFTTTKDAPRSLSFVLLAVATWSRRIESSFSIAMRNLYSTQAERCAVCEGKFWRELAVLT